MRIMGAWTRIYVIPMGVVLHLENDVSRRVILRTKFEVT